MTRFAGGTWKLTTGRQPFPAWLHSVLEYGSNSVYAYIVVSLTSAIRNALRYRAAGAA